MKLEYNFSDHHLGMIEEGADQSVSDFDPTPHDALGIMGAPTGDYIRMSVFDEDETFIRSFYSNLSIEDVEVIYTPGTSMDQPTTTTVMIPNPSGADFGLDSYPI